MVIDEVDAIAAAAHPVRAALLSVMREPMSAATAAREIGQSRQNAAYHVRILVEAGLLVAAGERQKGNFIEQLYRAAAPTMVLSPNGLRSAHPQRIEALADQASLGQLVELGDRLQRDAAVLLDAAAFDGEQIASASATTDIRFETEADRAAFLRDYVELVGELAERHGSPTGDRYRILLAAHPEVTP